MASKFHNLLREQIANEFGAMQQYVAIAVWADASDLPQIASQFYAHSLGERNHAMMMVQYLLDRGESYEVSAIEAPRNAFESPLDAYKAAQAHEVKVTGQIEALFHAAREENDPLGEQFILWFLREQVEEVANMDTMVTIAERAGDNWFDVERHLAREGGGASSNTGTPPAAAGGAI
ncbi:ferritin [Dietzia timorensis]|uniref:Ferritin n=1 Tax=Dietzia timorensis TaxID=499555 RepID=A0A173LQ92_9ACTN|nr:ferritin [Dietzia timorensis]ANI93884.1 Ferritin BfrB [Dietzia timorensis]